MSANPHWNVMPLKKATVTQHEDGTLSVQTDASILELPLGVFEGAYRYDNDNEYVLSVWRDGQTWDIRIPKNQSDTESPPESNTSTERRSISPQNETPSSTESPEA
jgi:hypothetical protein